MKANKTETSEQLGHSEAQLHQLMRHCQTKALVLDARLTILEADRGTR